MSLFDFIVPALIGASAMYFAQAFFPLSWSISKTSEKKEEEDKGNIIARSKMKIAQVHKNIQVPEHLQEENKIRLTDKVPNNLGQSPYMSMLENNLLNNSKNSIERQKMEHTNADMDILFKKLKPLGTKINVDVCEAETTVHDNHSNVGDFKVSSSQEELFVSGSVDSNEAENQKVKSPRMRRIPDVIDFIGDAVDTEVENRRMSSHSTPPLTPLFNLGQNNLQLKPEPDQPKLNTQQKPIANTLDAAPTYHEDDLHSIKDEPSNEKIEANMPTEKYSDEYNMNHPRRGRAIIFNHFKFKEDKYPERKGSELDAKRLHELYTELQFETTVYDNKEYREIKSILHSLSMDDHSDVDCLVVTVLTHGISSGYIIANDCPYPVETLWKPFTANKCTTLAGKPKFFFIQACRGERLDRGVTLVNRTRTRTVTDSPDASYEIPSHADFLIAYSSADSHYSFRTPEEGAWFIQSLHSEWKSSADSGDLLKILTRTARRVALDFLSYSDIISWQCGNKQVPSIASMLTRDVYFRPKQQ